MIIQSPELLIYKKEDAGERIDKYLLLLSTFNAGLAFGVKFNKRQSKPMQWLMEINGTCMLGGIGDFGNFQAVILSLSEFCQNTANFIGGHYLTGTGIVNFLSDFLRKAFEENAKALAVNFLVADWHNKEPDLCFVDFDGRIKQLKCFAVAGGSEYYESLNEEEIKKLSSQEKTFLEKKKSEVASMEGDVSLIVPSKIYQPRKRAITYLEKTWKPNMRKEKAVNLLKNTLFECNPESHDQMIEITVIIPGKEPEPLYFKQGKNKK